MHGAKYGGAGLRKRKSAVIPPWPRACSVTAMRVNGTLDTSATGGFKSSALELRAIEKTSLSSQLGHQAQQNKQPEPKTAPPLQVEIVSRREMTAFDPLWDGPRLVPSFVTQVLAQAMPDNHEPNMTVETAYGTAAPRLSLLVDRTS